MPILKGQKSTPTAPATPASKPMPGGAPRQDAFAKRYNQSEGAKGGGYVAPDPGRYNGLITACEAILGEEKETPDNSSSAYLEVTITDDGDMQGKTTRIYYNFTNANGEDMPGLDFFKSALSMLGFNEPLTSWDHCKEVLKEIADQQPWVIIDVKKKGQYTNVYLNSVPENQDEKPSLN